MKPDTARRLFRLIVRVYPPDFRERYGTDLDAFFRDELDASRARGESAGRFWLRVLTDGLLAGIRLRLRSARPSDHGGGVTLPYRPNPTDGWGWGGMIQDLRYALRSLRRAPLFLFFAAVTLALGVGATTAARR